MRSERVWLFDLDNTLHQASPHIFPFMSRAMGQYVAAVAGLDEAGGQALRDHYWQRYGATLLGLMRHHQVNPHDFLAVTHDFPDLPSMVVAEPALRFALRKLPGRKIVFSNAPQHYVTAVLKLIGVHALIDSVWGIERLRFLPKPYAGAYRQLLRQEKLNPRRCILVEDSAANLRSAKRLGMTTVFVSAAQQKPAYVDVRIKSVLELPKLRLNP